MQAVLRYIPRADQVQAKVKRAIPSLEQVQGVVERNAAKTFAFCLGVSFFFLAFGIGDVLYSGRGLGDVAPVLPVVYPVY